MGRLKRKKGERKASERVSKTDSCRNTIVLSLNSVKGILHNRKVVAVNHFFVGTLAQNLLDAI